MDFYNLDLRNSRIAVPSDGRSFACFQMQQRVGLPLDMCKWGYDALSTHVKKKTTHTVWKTYCMQNVGCPFHRLLLTFSKIRWSIFFQRYCVCHSQNFSLLDNLHVFSVVLYHFWTSHVKQNISISHWVLGSSIEVCNLLSKVSPPGSSLDGSSSSQEGQD